MKRVADMSTTPKAMPIKMEEDTELEKKHLAEGASKIQRLQKLVEEMTEQELVASYTLIHQRLRRDFVLEIPAEICAQIFGYLDYKDVMTCEMVAPHWHRVIRESGVWRRLLQHYTHTDKAWQMLANSVQFPKPKAPVEWKQTLGSFVQTLRGIEANWRKGNFKQHSVKCNAEGIYTLQYDDTEILTGNRDNTIKVWDLLNLKLKQSVPGHLGSVLCLQYDEDKVITSSSDNTIRIWDRRNNFEEIRVIRHHAESVLHVRFDDEYMVSCSKDRTIVIWHQRDAKGFDYRPMHTLRGHTAAVNVVEFNKSNVVSASGDRTLRVWDTKTGRLKRVLEGHTRGIACIHYNGDFVVSGSSDHTIRLWDVETGECLHTYTGHGALVRCVRFSSKFLVSGSYDGTVRVWDLHTGECVQELAGHENRVFRVQFDAFKIVSSSQDDTIRVWDFADDVNAKFARACSANMQLAQ